MSLTSVEVESLLALVRAQFQMDVAFVSTIENGRRTVRCASVGSGGRVVVGEQDLVADTYCHLIARGRIPRVAGDAAAITAVSPTNLERGRRIGAYAGTPLLDRLGAVRGSLFAYSREPRPALSPSQEEGLVLAAEMIDEKLSAHDAAQQARLSERLDVMGAVEQGGLTLHYQPILDLSASAVSGCEALARFEIADHRVRPDLMFQRAHAAGLGVELELQVLDQALRTGPVVGRSLSVNLSAAAIMSDLFPQVMRAVPRRELADLTIEVTEHEVVDDYEQLRQRLAPYRQDGVKIAVDDLGAGFANLKHAVDLAADIVKIDKALIHRLDAHPRQRAVVASIVTYASQTGTAVVAEGVETVKEHETVRALGVRFGQGYLLGRPAPAATLPVGRSYRGSSRPPVAALAARWRRSAADDAAVRELFGSAGPKLRLAQDRPDGDTDRLIEELVDYAVLMLDPSGHVISWNRGAERIKGYTPDEILGQHFSVFYPPEDVAAGACERLLHTAELQGRVEDEGWRITSKGTRFWANVVITAMHDSSGRLTGFGKVTRDLSERRQHEQRLEHLSTHDALTHLLNRHAFSQTLMRHLDTQAAPRAGVLLLVSIDQFTSVNEHLGHAAGDALLVHTAQLLQRQVATSGGVAARVGGDEFALLMPTASVQQASQSALAIIDGVANHGRRTYAAARLKVSASVGVCSLRYARDVDTAMGPADKALHDVKRAGGGTMVLAQGPGNGALLT